MIQKTLRVPSHSGRETTSDFRHINQKREKKSAIALVFKPVEKGSISGTI